MYCTRCGKEIKNNSKFCPYCGNGLPASGTENVKDTLKKTAGAVVDSAKVIGNSVNEATNGQAQKYAEKAKETAKGFTDDVKQVTKDKDASNFFTKNKYRNVKIIVVLLLAVLLISSVFGGGSKNEELAKNIFTEQYPNYHVNSVTTVGETDNECVCAIKCDECAYIVYMNFKTDRYNIEGPYSKSELDKQIDTWKWVLEQNKG